MTSVIKNPLPVEKDNLVSVANTTVTDPTDNKQQSVIQPIEAKPKPNICFKCRKKTGLLGFKCKCENNFCSEHRYAEEHNCTYDYKSESKNILMKNNPQVLSDKLTKI